MLESENRPFGVVTAISGASRGEIKIVGESAHAGAAPMLLRRDALAAAAVMISAIESRARAEPDLVATVGRLEIAHPAVNTVPGAVSFTLDVRAPDDAVRKGAVARHRRESCGNRRVARRPGAGRDEVRGSILASAIPPFPMLLPHRSNVWDCRPAACRAALATTPWPSVAAYPSPCCSSAVAAA